MFNVAVADVFAEIANSNAVLNADGTFRILDNAVTRSGTKLAVSGTAVQYYNKAKGRFDSPFTYTYTETPLSLRAHTLTNAMLITEMLQIDQLGASRLANDAQKIYYAGR